LCFFIAVFGRRREALKALSSRGETTAAPCVSSQELSAADQKQHKFDLTLEIICICKQNHI